MATRFLPNLEYIFELDTVQQLNEIEDALTRLLQGWGHACRGEYRHLGFARIQLEARQYRAYAGSHLSEDEVMLVDRAAARLREEQPDYYELMRLRYLKGLNIKQVGEKICRSSKVVRKRLGLLLALIFNLLAIEFGAPQRLAMAARVFGVDYISSLGCSALSSLND